MPHTLTTTYALPSDNQLGNGSAISDDALRARRVQEQVKMKLAEKGTLPRQNGKASQYAMSDYGGSSTMKYSNYSPNYSSRSSFMQSGSKTLGPRMSTRTDFSSRSAVPDITQFQRMSVGGVGGGIRVGGGGGVGGGIRVGGGGGVGGGIGGGGGGFYREEMHSGGFQGSIRQNQMDRDDMSVHSMRNMQTVSPWLVDNSDAGSLISERDGTFDPQYSQSSMNGFGQIKQGGGTIIYKSEFQSQDPAAASMRRSISGTLSRGGGLGGGGSEIVQQQSFKGPAHRTISRIANRNRMSTSSMSGSRMTSSSGNIGAGGDRVDSGFLMSTKSGSHGNLYQQRYGGMMRSTSMRSVQSVGGGADIFGQMDLEDMPAHLQGINDVDLPTAAAYVRAPDPALQILGSACLQHICYNRKSAKDEVRELHVTDDLVGLFNSDDPEVRRYSTGAMRNMIFQHNGNKQDLVDSYGVSALIKALEIEDEELRKNITGILWNLSAREGIKDKMKGIFSILTEKIVVPICEEERVTAEKMRNEQDFPSDSSSETEIFLNTMGCLRNMSSGSEKVRKDMRETRGLVDSLVTFLHATIDTERVQGKGAENAMCILRNLSYSLYDEIPPSLREKFNCSDTNTTLDPIGCFSPNSRKLKQKKYDTQSFSANELSSYPKDMEWLCHPKIVPMYNLVIKNCEINAITREAAIGALQNITAGQLQWAVKMSRYIVYEQKMLPILMDLLHSERCSELRSLTGLMRILSSHADTSTLTDAVVKKLPESDRDVPDPDVLVNLCGVLNNLVTRDLKAAQRITENSGVARLIYVRKLVESDSTMAESSKSAAIVLRNLYYYRKLHPLLRKKGYKRADFICN